MVKNMNAYMQFPANLKVKILEHLTLHLSYFTVFNFRRHIFNVLS